MFAPLIGVMLVGIAPSALILGTVCLVVNVMALER
jgi:hypothetical protein